MIIYVYILMVLLHIWFFGCVVSYKTRSWVIVEGTGISGIEFKWWIIYISVSILFTYLEYIGKWVLPLFLLVWFVIQFYSHWNYTLFGSSERKLDGYNQYFKNTFKIISSSDRIIPDLYHIILHILILSLFITTIIYLY